MSKHDGELVRQVLAGDKVAYEQLVSSYQGRIFAFVASRIRNFSATEDVVQNAFVEAYVHLKSLKSPEKFSGWLRGIALNLSNKWLQQKRPTVSIDDTPTDVTTEASGVPLPDLPDEVLEASEMKAAVLTAIDSLQDIYRETVLLHYMEGMTYPEIAAFLDVPESTVTGRLQVARNRLRDELMPLVEETLQEKRSTPQLTRKVMAALPPLLYLAAPAQASLLAKLKGTAMLKMIGIIGAGILGTGVYFGGISTLLNWQGNGDRVGTPQVSLELEGGEQPNRIDKETQSGDQLEFTSQNSAENLNLIRFKLNTHNDSTVSISSTPVNASPKKSEEKVEKVDFKMKSSPQDSLVKITYEIPKAIYPDPVFVEITVFDMMGATVAKPVNKMHKPGLHTVFLSKRGLPDGMHFVRLGVDHSNENAVQRKLKLVWTERK